MKHWTENDYLDWIYGLKEESSHLDECQECRMRADRVTATRREATREPEVSWEFLAAQRRSIYRLLGTPVRQLASLRWAVSLATMVLAVVFSFALLHPNQSPVALTTPSDAKLFSDLVSIDESNEPRAISPIHNLFEE